MNKWLKALIIFIFIVAGIVVVLIVGAILLFLSFRESVTPDEKEEGKVISQAEQYLQETYPTMEYEISDVEYDKGEQYDKFDYAAVILNTETQNTFIVYENEHTKQMEDDIEFQELSNFIEQVKPKVNNYITEKFGEPNDIAFTPSIDNPSSLTISLNNKKEEIDEEMFESFIDYLQNELKVEHASVYIIYDDETWTKEF